MNRFKIVLGDPYQNGHSKYSEIYIETNHNENELSKLYENMCKKFKVDFREICDNYQDNKLPRKVLKLLPPELLEDVTDGICTPSDFVRVILFLMEKVDKDFKWSIIKEGTKGLKIFNGMGYGIFD